MGGEESKPLKHVRNLSVIFDDRLKMEEHMKT